MKKELKPKNEAGTKKKKELKYDKPELARFESAEGVACAIGGAIRSVCSAGSIPL